MSAKFAGLSRFHEYSILLILVLRGDRRQYQNLAYSYHEQKHEYAKESSTHERCGLAEPVRSPPDGSWKWKLDLRFPASDVAIVWSGESS